MVTGQTDNGLRYAVRKSGTAVGYCALSIRCGTRDEEGFPAGIAHFTEHTLFRGTRHKSAATIAGYLDRLGGELNAYTTKEEIVLHATVLKEDLPKAIGLLLELATEATFPDAEIATERGVVLDEIISYKDSPSEDIYDKFEEALFAGHPLGRPILGTQASVRKISPEDLRRFTARHFRPERMALTVVSPLDEPRMEKDVKRLAGKYFPSIQEGTAPAPLPGITAAATPGKEALPKQEATPDQETLPDITAAARPLLPAAPPFDRTVNKRNHEVNAVIGGRAPSLYEKKDRITAVLLANILGGPASNSLLNSELREKRGWVYSIECNYTQYADTGIMAITFGCDKPHLDTCLRAIGRILDRLQEEPLTERRLKAAKKQLAAQIAVGAESGEARCLAMGKSLLAFGHIATPADDRAAIDAVTAADLRDMARRIFAPDVRSRLIYL